MTAASLETRKPLYGIIIGISISDTLAMQRGGLHRGLDAGEVDRITRIVAQDLLAEGAAVVLGHDWRPGGVMWEVLRVAQAYQPSVSLSDSPLPALQNWIPWPDPLPLEDEDRKALRGVLRIRSAGLPRRLEEIADGKAKQDPQLTCYLRARGLTHMRRTIVEGTHARVCLGGRTEGSAGRYPGIIEEALLTIEAGKPLYVSRLLGGASEHIVRALHRESMPEDFAVTRDDVREAYSRYAAEFEAEDPDARISRHEVWDRLAAFGIEGLAKTNGLSVEGNRHLFQCQHISEIRYYLLHGLGRLRADGAL